MAKRFTTPKITINDIMKSTKGKEYLKLSVWYLTVLGMAMFLISACEWAKI